MKTVFQPGKSSLNWDWNGVFEDNRDFRYFMRIGHYMVHYNCEGRKYKVVVILEESRFSFTAYRDDEESGGEGQ